MLTWELNMFGGNILHAYVKYQYNEINLQYEIEQKLPKLIF